MFDCGEKLIDYSGMSLDQLWSELDDIYEFARLTKAAPTAPLRHGDMLDRNFIRCTRAIKSKLSDVTRGNTAL